ncbi:MAG TPA: hypothetical protein VJP86_12860 [Vicinamibacterales bacterium]|jgi:hypothetical protein|nr:hypothetical protein [Vicinamibacterales bacterium]
MLFALLAVVLLSDSVPAQSLPDDVARLVGKAGVRGRIASWCRGTLQPGRGNTFHAFAVSDSAEGGRYVVLNEDAAVTELATFKRSPDLSCYSQEQADALRATIARSATIHGDLRPRWTGTVVCGFVDDTESTCWQYSSDDRRFVRVGGWTT